MNLNFSTLLFNIQENTANLLVDNSTIIETEQISMWQLIWGYDSISGEYSLTSLIVMSLSLLIGHKLLIAKNFSKLSKKYLML